MHVSELMRSSVAAADRYPSRSVRTEKTSSAQRYSNEADRHVKGLNSWMESWRPTN